MKELKDLQVNDLFKFRWGKFHIVGIVKDTRFSKILFDDVLMLQGNDELEKNTSIYFNEPDEDFEYEGFIMSYIPCSPTDVLQKEHPEYFL